MKKTMALCALLIGFGVHAQHRAPKHGDRAGIQNELTVEQQATLQSKRMTLALGLDPRQREQVGAVLRKHLEQRAQKRAQHRPEAGTGAEMEPQSRYLRISEHLDRQIALQEDLRGILTEQQFELWKTHRESHKSRRHGNSGKPGKHAHTRGQE